MIESDSAIITPELAKLVSQSARGYLSTLSDGNMRRAIIHVMAKLKKVSQPAIRISPKLIPYLKDAPKPILRRFETGKFTPEQALYLAERMENIASNATVGVINGDITQRSVKTLASKTAIRLRAVAAY